MNKDLPVAAKPKNRRSIFNPPRRPRLPYLWSVLLVAVATSLGFLVELDISPTNLVMIYLLAVVIAAVYLGRGPAILVSILGVLAFDFFFIPPYFTLAVSQTEYLITFAGLFLVGLVISALAVRAREQAEAAGRREAETAALYALSRDLAAADGLDAVLEAIRIHIRQTFDRESLIQLGEGQPADSFLLETASRKLGALSLGLPELDLSARKRRLLEAFASQAAQAIERIQLAEQARQVKLLQAAEKLQNALLNSISHDLRTPLVSITGALSTLEQNSELDEVSRQSLVTTAREEADRLNRLVGNLLDMTRLESGALQVKRAACDAQDLIGAALGQMESRLTDRRIRVEVAPGIPPVSVDFVLIVHVLINLLDNALKYSPENSPLEIQAHQAKNGVQIALLDRGPGIPLDDLSHIFDKFFRVRRSGQVAGTGLGLAICKGIVEAHGGQIWAAPREGGGTVMTFELPLESQNE